MTNIVLASGSLSRGWSPTGETFTDLLVALAISVPVGFLVMFGLGRLDKKHEAMRARGEKIAKEPETKIVYPASPYNRPHLGVKVGEEPVRGSRKDREREAAEAEGKPVAKTPPPPKKIKNKARRPAGSGRKN